MIVAIYIEEYEDLIDTPQTINLGGKYLYEFKKEGKDTIIVSRTINEQYVEGFFNVDSDEKDSDDNKKEDKASISLVTAIVGENGVGKTRLMGMIIEQNYNDRYLLIYEELDGIMIFNNLKISHNNYKKIEHEGITKYKLKNYHYSGNRDKFYYTPYFNSKSQKDMFHTAINLSLEKEFRTHIDDKLESYDMLSMILFEKQLKFMASDLFINNISKIFFKDTIPHHNIALHDNNYKRQKDEKLPEVEHQLILKLLIQPRSSENSKTYLYNYILVSLIYIFSKKFNRNFADSKAELVSQKDLDSLLCILISAEYKKSYHDELKVILAELKAQIENISGNIISFKTQDSKYGPLGEIEDDKTSLLHTLVMDGKTIVFINNLYSDVIRKIYKLFEDKDISDSYVLSIKTQGILYINPTYNLSGGEEAILNIFSQLYYYINNEINPKILRKQEKIFLFFDEADLGFHPTWKKKYVKLLLETLPHFFPKETKLQIIFTTHDPLTLSDMPNNNVVFLAKDKETNTTRIINKKEKPNRTFGANVTDILAHSFFVQNGLIGDFAKDKINATISWIDKHKKDKTIAIDKAELEKHRRIVNMIDEPVIRKKLLEMLQDLAPEDKVQKIDDEMKELQKRMEELVKQKENLKNKEN